MIGALAIVVGVGSLAWAGLSTAERLATGRGDGVAIAYFVITGIGCILGGLAYTGA